MDNVFRPYTLEEGAYLVALARRAVEHYLKTGSVLEPTDAPPRLLRDSYGVFTTVERLEGGRLELRGCIGYPQGYRNTAVATVHSAIGACCQDPRFPPVTPEEVQSLVFEVSVLSPLTQLEPGDPRRYLEQVKVGIHGVVVKRGQLHSGLLLPQVAVEQCWDVEDFLSHACIKAWLDADCWLDRRTKVYVYQAQIFREERPLGTVFERDLAGELRRCPRRSPGTP